jgi:hypothetical protein
MRRLQCVPISRLGRGHCVVIRLLRGGLREIELGFRNHARLRRLAGRGRGRFFQSGLGGVDGFREPLVRIGQSVRVPQAGRVATRGSVVRVLLLVVIRQRLLAALRHKYLRCCFGNELEEILTEQTRMGRFVNR